MITILDTKITISMNWTEAKQLAKELGDLSGLEHKDRPHMNAVYQLLSKELALKE